MIWIEPILRSFASQCTLRATFIHFKRSIARRLRTNSINYGISSLSLQMRNPGLMIRSYSFTVNVLLFISIKLKISFYDPVR